MTQYLITKREECTKCVDGYVMLHHAKLPPETAMPYQCGCKGGHIDTQVDANEWLREMLGEVRFGIGRDDGRDCLIDPRWNTNKIED